ncbi:MAG TPA: ATPase domain-containing protein [Alphaproteobacteria bacterium]|nr:ATPase domain-containing protein [Alphaproteobacteria bacterium]
MTSELIIKPVDKLQSEIILKLKTLRGKIGIYVSLNKPQKSVNELFQKSSIDTSKLFFIDCVSKEVMSNDVINLSPNDLDTLSLAINTYIKDIPGEKFLIIDALSTLLIYNNENKVAEFIQGITKHVSENKIVFLAFSPKTEGEELLNKIFNFFDNVETKK